MEEQTIPPSRQALEEALELSAEILKNIELSDMPLARIALKASRLARLLNDFDVQRVMEYKAQGYPSPPGGISLDVWRLATLAGRTYQVAGSEPGENKERAYVEAIGQLEEELHLAETSVTAARDPDVSITSANPYQQVHTPFGNQIERDRLRRNASSASSRIASRSALIYRYALNTHYELKFGRIADDVFSRVRVRVDSVIGQSVPDAVQRLTAAYENLRSDNPEDWSNAVHSCRRILQDLADAVFPATEEIRVKESNGGRTEIKLGEN